MGCAESEAAERGVRTMPNGTGFVILVDIMSRVKYLGDLRCEALHLKNGCKVYSDAAKEFQGKGENFTPADLLAVSYAECVLTTIANRCKAKSINVDNSFCDLMRLMGGEPRRVVEIILNFKFSKKYNDEEKKFIKEASQGCPVGLSLSSDLKKTMTFEFTQ